eukprot:6471791-Amphidinium_carterae.2
MLTHESSVLAVHIQSCLDLIHAVIVAVLASSFTVSEWKQQRPLCSEASEKCREVDSVCLSGLLDCLVKLLVGTGK